jgi:hypothetical protein
MCSPEDPGSPREADKLGRRRQRRVPAQHLVELQGSAGRHQARLLDLSPTGALLTFVERAFNADDARSTLAVAARIDDEFGEGLVVRFVGKALVAHARVVHTTQGAEPGQTVVGLAFEPELTEKQRAALRLR